MKLRPEDAAQLDRLRAARGASFAELISIAGLNPSTDFRHADLTRIDFGEIDLAGFDFTGADLTGADLRQARTAGASFDDADVDGVRWPPQTAHSTTIRTWPWHAEVQSPEPELQGDLEAVLQLGIVSSLADLQSLSALLAAGVPPGESSFAAWEQTSRTSCEIRLTSASTNLLQRFNRIDDGLEVSFDLFTVSADRQRTGLASRLFRNALLAYDQLGVAYVSFHANFETGAYVWATLGGRPFEPDLVRVELIDRLLSPLLPINARPADKLALRALIEGAEPERLMFDVSRAITAEGARPGRDLLIGYAWDGYWDLADPGQRDHILEALA